MGSLLTWRNSKSGKIVHKGHSCPCSYRNGGSSGSTPAQPQAGSDSNNHIQSAHSSSHSSSPAGNIDTVAVDKTHTPKFLLCTKTGLAARVLFLCRYQPQTAEFHYMKYPSVKKFSAAQFLTRKKESDKTSLTSCCHFVST